MIQGKFRVILYFDLAMVPHPSDAPALPLADFIPHLEKRCRDKVSCQVIDAERRVIRLTDTGRVKTKSGGDAVAMLFSLGDRDKADPGFTHFTTGKVRIPLRERDEAGGLSVHAILSLAPTTPRGHLYRMVYEDVSGLGRTIIQNFLRAEFRIISEEQDLTFQREGGAILKTRPMVEVTGHASQKIKDSLKEGRLLNIELIDYLEIDMGFDESKYIKTAHRDMSLSIANNLPKGDSLSFIEKVKTYAHRNGYEAMRVRWRDPDVLKPQSAKVDTVRADAGEAFFIKSAEVNLDTALPDICENLSRELVSKMAVMVE